MVAPGDGGGIVANDIRELENLDRIPEELGGDLYLINGNMTKLADAGIFNCACSGEMEIGVYFIPSSKTATLLALWLPPKVDC